MPLPDTPLTLGEQLPDTLSELDVTPLTLVLNTALTVMELEPVEPPDDTGPLKLTLNAAGTTKHTHTHTRTQKWAKTKQKLKLTISTMTQNKKKQDTTRNYTKAQKHKSTNNRIQSNEFHMDFQCKHYQCKSKRKQTRHCQASPRPS